MSKENKKITNLKLFFEEHDYEIYDIVIKKNNELNNIIIYLNNTSNLDEIIEITKKVNHYLDEGELQNEEYMLEVSSKGLVRKLTTLNHYQKSIGEQVEFVVAETKQQGTIQKVENDQVEIIVGGENKVFLIKDIKKCQTILIEKVI